MSNNKYFYNVLRIRYGEDDSTTVLATYENRSDAVFLAKKMNLAKGYGAFFDDEGIFEEVNPEADEGEYYIVKRTDTVTDKNLLNKNPYEFIF